jgi:hypothetical protein
MPPKVQECRRPLKHNVGRLLGSWHKLREGKDINQSDESRPADAKAESSLGRGFLFAIYFSFFNGPLASALAHGSPGR